MHCWIALKLNYQESNLEFHRKPKYAVNLTVSFVAFFLQIQDGDDPQGIKNIFACFKHKSFKTYV